MLLVMLGLVACGQDQQPEATTQAKSDVPAEVFVQLFEWRWDDVAAECENFLGPAGYAAVQISPPQEHVKGSEWWTRYQPVSYKIESRSGTRAEFADMVQRCKNAGVDIYADALTNHMSDVGNGTGVAGSTYTEYSYPVPYEFDDFHHCGRNGNESIKNYQDQWEVQNCKLGGLADLDTSKPEVQAKIAAYLNDLLSLGVTGFRLDAVKHIAHEEVAAILGHVDGSPVVLQEVPDRGNEPINAHDYLGTGSVIEVKYPAAMTAAFLDRDLSSLYELEKRDGFLPADQSVVFVDNHDLQRGHAGSERILRYKDGKRYDLAVGFMLAYPYGYPMVMSSYYFENSDQGPDNLDALNEDGSCNGAWVCEHRRHATANMVKFRRVTAGNGITNWQVVEDNILSFGRGDLGHVVINVGDEAIRTSVASDLPAGQYCDVISGGSSENGCSGASVDVDNNGRIEVSLEPLSIIAIHSETKLTSQVDTPNTHEIEVVVRVPENSPTVYLSGNIDALGPWDPDALAMSGEGRERRLTVNVPDGHDFEFKVTLGSWDREAVNTSGSWLPNFTLKANKDQRVEHEVVAFKMDPVVFMTDWQNSGVLGTLVYWQDVASEFLSETRHVEIWLPPGYEDDPDRRYKVIYMHDGQNLFDPRIANTGSDWGVDEAIMRGVEGGRFEAAIVVGSWSSAKRVPEYSPWHEAPQYARFLIEELMPRVNAEFRTLTEAQNTVAMGSSMGGLLSYYLVKEHADVFSACGCVSSHFPFSAAHATQYSGGNPAGMDATPYVLRDIEEGATITNGTRFFFDYGSKGLDASYGPPHAAIRDWLLEQNLVEGQDFLIREYEGADHNEASWRARVGDQLAWLLADE